MAIKWNDTGGGSNTLGARCIGLRVYKDDGPPRALNWHTSIRLLPHHKTYSNSRDEAKTEAIRVARDMLNQALTELDELEGTEEGRIRVMLHALGFEQSGREYRNYYLTPLDSPTGRLCQANVDSGWMKVVGNSWTRPEDVLFEVTGEGKVIARRQAHRA